MKDELAAIYEKSIFGGDSEVVTESEKVKSTTLKPGKGFEGEEMAKKMQPGTGTQSKGVDVKSPASNKRFSSGSSTVKETSEREINTMLPESEFEKMFKSTLISEEPELGDESPLERDEFNDEEGDFNEPGEDVAATEEEEVDVATELRMIIDRLTEIAEKMGAYDEEDMGDEEVAADEEGLGGGEEMGGEENLNEPPVGESHVTKELKPLPNTACKMQGKSNMKVKSKFSPDGGSASKAGPGKGAADGKLKPLGKGKFGPSMSMKADATSAMGKQGSSLFGSK
jgi:hypothetical protein